MPAKYVLPEDPLKGLEDGDTIEIVVGDIKKLSSTYRCNLIAALVRLNRLRAEEVNHD